MLIRGGIIMRISMISNVILTSEQSQDYHLENVNANVANVTLLILLIRIDPR